MKYLLLTLFGSLFTFTTMANVETDSTSSQITVEESTEKESSYIYKGWIYLKGKYYAIKEEYHRIKDEAVSTEDAKEVTAPLPKIKVEEIPNGQIPPDPVPQSTEVTLKKLSTDRAVTSQ